MNRSEFDSLPFYYFICQLSEADAIYGTNYTSWCVMMLKVLAVIFNKEIWREDIKNGGWQPLYSLVCLQFSSLPSAVSV